VGLVYFRKDLAFDKEFRFVFFRRVLVTFVVTLPLAFYFRDYRALVIGTLVGSVVGLVLSYYLHPYRPSFGLRAWRELFGFSKWMLATSVVGVVSGRAADFIIGRLAGIGALGVFSLSREIAMLPSSELAAPMNRAVFSGYARLSGDIAALRQGYLKVVSVLSLVVLPAGVGLCLVASPVVHLLLGQKWLEAIPIIRILAIEGVLVVGLSTAHYIYLAIGQPEKLTKVLAMQAVVSITLMLAMIPKFGLVGASLARVAASIVTAPINLKIVARALEMPLLNVVVAVRRALMATAVMSIAVLLLQSVWASVVTPAALVVHLAASVLLGMCTYALAILCLWNIAGRPDGAERFVLQRVQSLFLKLRRTG
jgi:O-antigen/teichoic acid export membrane protein